MEERSAGAGRRGFPVGAAATIDEFDRDPHPLLARLRASEPVSWLPALDGWLVTRRDLALAALRDVTTFTVDDPRFSTAQVIGPSMLSLDGAAHARHRDPFARAFRPGATRARFTAYVATEVDRLVGALRPRGAAEIRGQVAGPLAVAVIAHALGLRDADPTTVRSWYEAFVAAISDITAGRPGGTTGRAHERAYAELRASVAAAIRGGAATETETTTETTTGAQPSLLAAAGRELAPADVVANAAVLMFGGIDTTEGMITNAVLHLLDHPRQLTFVRAEPALVASAIEESLRLEPSASVVDRYATRDIEFGGAPIRAGDLIRVSLAGANRDPAAFPDPDRFDVRRAGLGRQLAFAHGPHFCFGAPLARLETHAVLTALLERLPGLGLDPARRHPPRGLVFRKPAALYVRWDTGSAAVSAARLRPLDSALPDLNTPNMDGQPAYPVRASDGERDRVLRALSDRVAEGRMSTDTFERRVDQVLRARSRGELHDIVHDLPPRGRLISALTSAVSSVSAATAQLGAAWRTPRLPRFVLPPADLTRILIGRAPGCHFVLTDLTVSRFHAELYRAEADEKWLISDLGSMNGTRVNGWRLTGPAPLRAGDQVGFGHLTFIVAAPAHP